MFVILPVAHMDKEFPVENKVTASLMTANGPLQIFTMDALAVVISSLPCPGGKSVAPCSDTLDGFTIAEWASLARKKPAIASSVSRLNGALKAKFVSQSVEGDKNKVENKDSGVDPWSLAIERGQSRFINSTMRKDNGAARSSWVPSHKNLKEDVEGVGAIVVKKKAGVKQADDVHMRKKRRMNWRRRRTKRLRRKWRRSLTRSTCGGAVWLNVI